MDTAFLFEIGRGERIRTSDPMHPMHVRYQAALRPDSKGAIIGYLLFFFHEKMGFLIFLFQSRFPQKISLLLFREWIVRTL